MPRNYWVFRIHTKNRDFLYNELINKEKLRQGWGILNRRT